MTTKQTTPKIKVSIYVDRPDMPILEKYSKMCGLTMSMFCRSIVYDEINYIKEQEKLSHDSLNEAIKEQDEINLSELEYVVENLK